MNHVLNTTTGAFGETLADAINATTRTFATLTERAKLNAQYRKTVRELNKLTPRELQDLGLSSGNIHSAAYEAVYG